MMIKQLLLTGGVIMTHGDDMGLRLPPKMAPVQLVVVPITRKNADVEAINAAAKKLVSAASTAGIRAKLDDDATKSPGYRFSYWEQKVRYFDPHKVDCFTPSIVSAGPKEVNLVQDYLYSGRRPCPT